MAIKKSKSSAPEKSDGMMKKVKNFSIILLVTLALAVIIGGIYGIIQIPKVLMTENKRFSLRHIVVDGDSYWAGRGDELGRRFDIKKGTNLFELDLEKIRTDLKKEKSINDCEVEIVLPDTLKIKINEGVPRAILNIKTLKGSDYIWVVDESGKYFTRKKTGVPVKSLPIIKDFNTAYTDRLQPALRLTMTAMQDYPDIKFFSVSIKHKDHLETNVEYRNTIKCLVRFPIKDDYRPLLNTLQSLFLQASSEGKTYRIYDLRFDGRPTTI